MAEKFVIFPNTVSEEQNKFITINTSNDSKRLQSLKFSAKTRRLPVFVFWLFMGLSVMVAGVLAHNRTNLQAFWNQEAVLNRSKVLQSIPLGLFFDSLSSRINQIFVKKGWIVAGALIIFVQSFYLFLVMTKRDRTPALQFIRNYNLKEMAAIEIGVLLLGTFYFLICTMTFNWISFRFGSCTNVKTLEFSFPTSKSACSGTFRGFDISGHCFLIVHSCLLALEYAAKLLFVWHAKERNPFSSAAESNDKDSDIESLSDQFDHEDVKSNDLFNRNYSLIRFVLIVLIFGVFILCLAEFLVFLQTILFYHTILEKILGTFIGAWFWIGLFILSSKYPHLF